MIKDLLKNDSQKDAARVDYYPVSHRDSQIQAEQNGNFVFNNGMMFQRSMIVFNNQHAVNIKDQAKHFVLVVA